MSFKAESHAVRQLAYAVPDVREAAERYSRMFGAGPFYIVEDILIPTRHHGRELVWKSTGAFGQWGDLMIELMRLDDQPPLHDVFPGGKGAPGLHHVAIIVEDADALVQAYEEQGHAVILEAQFGTILSRMVDTREVNGHLLEIYEPSAQLIGMYDFIRDEAVNFDGRDPVRPYPI
jgi:catechol 2,3-dioxygenase-like lactoylglutathione lyase family enzyme